MKELARAYEPADIEGRILAWWLARGDFTADPADPAPPFSIVIPPPNVTGSLHVGHALDNTLQDVLVRRKRMQGFATLWLPGTDHAGIATQVVVERSLAEQGRTRVEMGREAFEREVWAWKEKYGARILEQLQRLGCSCDWTRTRFTMDPGLSLAVRKVFVHLHEQGLVHRGPYMVSWCVRCATALSDLEVEHEDSDGTLWRIAYPLADGSGELVVATTRPETLLGDTALAVSPDDERYRGLVGRTAKLPLLEREIPIVADAHVDPAFGTGVVKVTPAHDPNDWEIGRRHGLPLLQVIDGHGRITAAGGSYAGLERFEARRRVLADLEERGLRRGEQPHRHAVGTCQRCKSPVEPLVSTQWFLRMKPLADPAVAAVEDGSIRLHPDQYRKVYLNWMAEIRDWCISRQLWWGHRIPAWYCPDGHVTVAMDAPSACATCRKAELRQDEDVLDTWFSSQLWPFATLGWPEDTPDLRKWYPTSVLVTGFDILFFWVARMAMAGLRLTGQPPFRDVVLHGMVRDERGEKMSKVKGNVLDPLEVIETHGADALRFTLAVMSVPARDIPWNPQRMEGYRTFANKLWQAARFVQMNVGDERLRDGGATGRSVPDRWILARLAQTTADVNRALDEYRFHEAAGALYQFTWDEYCAWYIESAKPALAGADASATRQVLLHVLDSILRLLHPFMPFLTEEIWQHLPRQTDQEQSIQKAAYPAVSEGAADSSALADMERLKAVVTAVRNLRAETNLDPVRRVPIRLAAPDAAVRELLRENLALIAALARTEPPSLADAPGDARGCAVAEVAGVSILVPLAGLLDLEAERGRIAQQIDKVDKELQGLAGRLRNPAFVEKAKPEVVAEARARSAELEDRKERLGRTLRALAG